jgi:hypothetical protein
MGCFNSKVLDDHKSKLAQQSNHHGGVHRVESSSLRNSNRLFNDGSDPNASLKTLTFRHVMQDPLGREYFMKFLKVEHAEENLGFYEVSIHILLEMNRLKIFLRVIKSVEAIKASPALELANAVNELVGSYLLPGVETEVNISDGMKRNLIKMSKENVESNHEEFIKHLERAQKEIMMILAMGAFPRFLKSQYFVQYKLKLKELRQKEDEEDMRRAERA